MAIDYSSPEWQAQFAEITRAFEGAKTFEAAAARVVENLTPRFDFTKLTADFKLDSTVFQMKAFTDQVALIGGNHQRQMQDVTEAVNQLARYQSFAGGLTDWAAAVVTPRFVAAVSIANEDRLEEIQDPATTPALRDDLRAGLKMSIYSFMAVLVVLYLGDMPAPEAFDKVCEGILNVALSLVAAGALKSRLQ